MRECSGPRRSPPRAHPTKIPCMASKTRMGNELEEADGCGVPAELIDDGLSGSGLRGPGHDGCLFNPLELSEALADGGKRPG